jgi:hypothetical protein
MAEKETVVSKEVVWEIQRLSYHGDYWARTGYNAFSRREALRVLDSAKKLQPSQSFRLVRITEVKTTEVIRSA